MSTDQPVPPLMLDSSAESPSTVSMDQPVAPMPMDSTAGCLFSSTESSSTFTPQPPPPPKDCIHTRASSHSTRTPPPPPPKVYTCANVGSMRTPHPPPPLPKVHRCTSPNTPSFTGIGYTTCASLRYIRTPPPPENNDPESPYVDAVAKSFKLRADAPVFFPSWMQSPVGASFYLIDQEPLEFMAQSAAGSSLLELTNTPGCASSTTLANSMMASAESPPPPPLHPPKTRTTKNQRADVPELDLYSPALGVLAMRPKTKMQVDLNSAAPDAFVDLTLPSLPILYDVADMAHQPRLVVLPVLDVLSKHSKSSLEDLHNLTRVQWEAMNLPVGFYWILMKRLGLPRNGPVA